MIELTIIGAGLAGCEAAYQAAKRGIQVKLYEMRPFKMTPAHKTDKLAELVCSSSFKSQNPETAHGLLKSEMDKFGSLILDCARKSSVPGGDALCVDREKFSDLVTASIKENPLIEFINQEVTDVPTDKPCIIAAGPLVSESLALSLSKLTGNEHLHFFDAIAPSIDIETVDMNIAFKQSRYDKGEAAYFNCPMDKEEYYAFVDALVNAKIANMHLEEEKKPEYYEGCLPVEVMASRGKETLSFGMMKPVGLTDPRTGKRSYAVLQLRQENEEASVFGLVGCQTQLTISEQQRVFRLVPGLQNAKFVRYGAVHRNTYIESPKILNPTLNTRNNENLFLYNLYADNDSLHHKYRYQTGINIFQESKGKEVKVTATLTDTHATITTGSSIIVTQKLKWYEKPWLWGLAGMAGGFFLAK